MMGPLVTAALAVFFIVASGWFWPHCAEPMLRYVRAPTLARRIVLLVTVVAIIGQIVRIAALVFDVDAFAPFALVVVTGALWIVVVGLGYLTDYRWLVRVCRAVDGRSFR